MRAPIFTCLLSFLVLLLTTAPTSYGQGVDANAPPTLIQPFLHHFYLTSWNGKQPARIYLHPIYDLATARNAAGEHIDGRVITAYSPGSVAGKWQYLTDAWKDLPALNEGEGFLVAWGGANGSVRFVPLNPEQIDEAFVEAVNAAETPPSLSVRAWNEKQGTAERIATLADLGTSISPLTSERTITLDRIDDGRRVVRALEKAASQRDSQISALQAAAAQRDTEISTLQAAKSAEEVAAAQRDTKINALQAAIEALKQTTAVSNTDSVSTTDSVNNPLNNKDTVLHVVAPSSADEGVRAYPNPASRLLQVAGLAPAQTYTYRLYTADGKHVSQGTLQTNEPIDISPLGKGQYLLTIQDETGKQLFTTPLVVQ